MAGDKELDATVARLRRDADSFMKVEPFSVTSATCKRPSGDQHDYISLSFYCWPDPKNPDGPWIIKDGQMNPEVMTSKYSNSALWKMSEHVNRLSMAWYFTGEERYAAYATKLLRVFFLDASTRMNPNLKYAQFRPDVPSKSSGTSLGIIETCDLTKVVDAIGLLAGSASWTASEQKGMESWFVAYLDWLLKSSFGKEESNRIQNHGTWYDA